MNGLFLPFLEALLLVTALSTDALVAGFAYGSQRISIPLRCTACISFLCSLALAVSLLAGTLLRPFIPPNAADNICFILLAGLGIAKLFDSSIKRCIRRQKPLRRCISFSAMHLRFILTVYADPEKADLDGSRSLSIGEALTVGIALSLDGLAAGLSAALVSANCPLTILLSFLIGTAAILVGCAAGRKVSEKTSIDLSWLGGLLLLVLAFQKL